MTTLPAAPLEKSYTKDAADREIEECLNSTKPVSFFLFAGAGSGKTGSLVSALKHVVKTQSRSLRLSNQRVGVITYTVAASEEITERIKFNPLVEVSTIHSFIWTLIKGFDADIKKWVQSNLEADIADLQGQQLKGRAGKASETREKSIASKQRRLAALVDVEQFTYSPTGENRGRDSLNHAEVIKLGAEFLTNKPLMRSLLVNKYPVLFIDESQDTAGALIEAFMVVEERERVRFRLGLFGDMMQRIYADGKADLGQVLPDEWATPTKVINYRSPRRVVALINRLRSSVDGQRQEPRSDAIEGVARIFLVADSAISKADIERRARARMATVTSDQNWNNIAEVKTLILEHRMAAKRLGFLEMFSALYEADSLRTSLLDGTLASLQVFSKQVMPLIRASQTNDDFTIAALVRKYSPLLTKEALQAAGESQPAQVGRARDAAKQMVELFQKGERPSFGDVLGCIYETNLFEVPDALRPIALRMSNQHAGSEIGRSISENDVADPILDAWEAFLLTPFAQIEPYVQYVEGNAPFDTHQGIKGREFSRVLIIIDDEDARGFMFSYEKLFGAKAKSRTDIDNERDGKETGLDRTRRLFYVTCSRAKSSLGIVAYTSDTATVRNHILQQGWFSEAEIEIVP